jgi:hypothetical protein
MITDGQNDLHDGSNDLDDSDNKSDSYNSLRNLFSPAELNGDFLKTDLNVDIKQDRLHKRFLKNAVPAAKRSRTGDSASRNLILLSFLSGESL